jgi:transposase
VYLCRVECPRCGPKVQQVDWLDPYARVTRRLARGVALLCELLPIKHVAAYFDLKWDAVKRLHKRYLAEKLGAIDLHDVSIIAMDEFALKKGHRYATVIIDPIRREVLWVGRGRGAEDIRPFFELLGEEGRKLIYAVAMDMHAPYEKMVRDQCPHAEIVYDQFHVVAKYGREVVNRVRVDQAQKVKADKADYEVIKGSKWLLLKNKENITRKEDQVKLKELLAANKALMTVYVLKDDLKQLWDYNYEGAARNFWKSWYRRAVASKIEPLKQFARKLKSYLPGILAHCRWPLNTSVLEGINNKIKVMKRMAYGFRDDDYFFLRIRAAFPGKCG